MVRKVYGGKVIGWNEKEEVETPTRETHIYKDGKPITCTMVNREGKKKCN